MKNNRFYHQNEVVNLNRIYMATLNRIQVVNYTELCTLTEKPNFKNSVSNRCLVLVNGFYEWKWLDSKGKNKEKYFVQLDNGSKPFALGGIYNIWTNIDTNETRTNFSIATSNANELMFEIHNTKDRMPLILSKEAEEAWLSDRPVGDFAFPHYNP